MFKICTDAQRNDFCRALADAGIEPVFMPAIHDEPWGYAVASTDLVAAMGALRRAGITVHTKRKISHIPGAGTLRKGTAE